AAFGNARVKSGSLAAIFLMDEPYTEREPQNDFGGAVGRTVVHYDDFKLRSGIALLENAAQRLFDKVLVVIGIDENTEKHASDNSTEEAKSSRCGGPNRRSFRTEGGTGASVFGLQPWLRCGRPCDNFESGLRPTIRIEPREPFPCYRRPGQRSQRKPRKSFADQGAKELVAARKKSLHC